MKISVFAAFLALVAGPAVAQPTTPAIRTEALACGVNLSHWFAQSNKGYDAEHLQRFISRADLKAISDAGFRHVRLSISPRVVRNQNAMAGLIDAIRSSLSAQLSVIADLHPVGDEKLEFTGPEGSNRLAALWTGLARALSAFDPDRVFFEIMNEPHPLEGDIWLRMQVDALQAIRTQAPQHTVIVNPGGWSGPEDLEKMRALADMNVVYTVHIYAPLLFTHQGADWTWDVAKSVAGAGWPIPSSDAERAAVQFTSTRKANDALKNEISSGHFEQTFLAEEFARVERWQRQHGDPFIYLGEFGVYQSAVPRVSAIRWVKEVRDQAVRRGFGWAYWDSSESFGLVDRSNQGIRFQRDMREALQISGTRC